MIWHSSEAQDVVKFLNSDENNGLSAERADELYKLYTFEAAEKPSLIKIFFSQLKGYLAAIMLISALLSIVLSIVFKTNTWSLSVTAVAVIFLGTAFAAAEQYISEKTKRSVKAQKISSARVIRNGEEITVTSNQVVPGDILILNAGELIPADARLIGAVNFRCDEYVLTGETVDVEKDALMVYEDIAPTNERKNMVFADCCVTHGYAKAVVTDISPNTEANKQRQNLKTGKASGNAFENTIHFINKYSLIIAGITSTLIFILTILFNLNQDLNFSHFVVNTFMNSTAIIVSAIPETLPASIAIILWSAIKNMDNSGNYTPRSSAIEAVSGVSVICAEKTGVLTPNQMTVAKIFDGKKITDLTETLPDEESSAVVKMAMICGNAINFSSNSNEINTDSGDQAIADFCLKHEGLSTTDCLHLYPMVSAVDFDNNHRLITTVNMIGGKHYVITKGAPEALVNACANANPEILLKISEHLAEDALRVIGVAIKQIDEVPAIPSASELETELSFLGFIGLEDTPDYSTVKTVEQCEKAGIRTVMITGDSLTTAKAIARRIGIFHDSMNAITGEELSLISDEELDRTVNLYSVFARITPNEKYRIIKALQHNNETVAVTGSRNSDAPVLRKAAVGISPSGATDVVHFASDFSVKDTGIKNIANIIKASKSVFFNIRKIIHYFLSCNIGELLALLLSTLIFGAPALIAAQVLIINFITDVLPAISMSFSPIDSRVIYSRKKEHTKIFPLRAVITIAIQSVTLAVLTLIGFNAGVAASVQHGQTMALAVLGLSQIIHILPSYSERLMINSRLFKYKLIFAQVGISVAILLAIMLSPARALFGLAALTGVQWTTAILLVALFILIDELIKVGFYFYNKFKG